MAEVGPIKAWPKLDLHQYVEEYAQKFNKELAPIKYKSSHASIQISKEAAEKLYGPKIEKFLKPVWSCGCSQANDSLGGWFHCKNWNKQPNQCDRRRAGG